MLFPVTRCQCDDGKTIPPPTISLVEGGASNLEAVSCYKAIHHFSHDDSINVILNSINLETTIINFSLDVRS
jgi:hypothetical protein